MKKIILGILIFLFVVSGAFTDEPVKIMPLGDSITAGEHYKFPALAERTGYRKYLYEMLISAGYNVDFVGSQLHGQRPETDKDWYDWNNEAYPGYTAFDLVFKVKRALPVYKPDILLIHAGTNGNEWDKKLKDVVDILDFINKYCIGNNHPITVFLCKIINRFEGGDTFTTQFNNDVTKMVASRTGDKIKIIMVDMENGAGIDYSDNPPDLSAKPPYEGGDMLGKTYPGVSLDIFHPNDKGNKKMAVKFYKEIIKELGKQDTVDKK